MCRFPYNGMSIRILTIQFTILKPVKSETFSFDNDET